MYLLPLSLAEYQRVMSICLLSAFNPAVLDHWPGLANNFLSQQALPHFRSPKGCLTSRQLHSRLDPMQIIYRGVLSSPEHATNTEPDLVGRMLISCRKNPTRNRVAMSSVLETGGIIDLKG